MYSIQVRKMNTPDKPSPVNAPSFLSLLILILTKYYFISFGFKLSYYVDTSIQNETRRTVLHPPLVHAMTSTPEKHGATMHRWANEEGLFLDGERRIHSFSRVGVSGGS
ncbi:hypothetical protein BJX99DRAFT_58454 [Aspergillus californicus]